MQRGRGQRADVLSRRRWRVGRDSRSGSGTGLCYAGIPPASKGVYMEVGSLKCCVLRVSLCVCVRAQMVLVTKTCSLKERAREASRFDAEKERFKDHVLILGFNEVAVEVRAKMVLAAVN